jgi:hypothetical protein
MEWELDNEFMAGMCTTLVTLMFMVGLALVGQSIDSCPEVEDPNDMMATSAYSHDQYVKKNPKWNKALAGIDRDKWMAADEKEHVQQMERRPGKDCAALPD